MADGKKAVPVRVREKLRELVASGRVFCTLSWGIPEEVFDQSERFLPRTATLMEELSLNAVRGVVCLGDPLVAFFAFQTASVLALATKSLRVRLRAVRLAGAHAGKRKDEGGRM